MAQKLINYSLSAINIKPHKMMKLEKHYKCSMLCEVTIIIHYSYINQYVV